MNRNLEEVCKEVIKEAKCDELKNELNRLVKTLGFASPETQQGKWDKAYHIIMKYCTHPRNGLPEYKWQVRVLSIWSTKSIEAVCDQCGIAYGRLDEGGFN